MAEALALLEDSSGIEFNTGFYHVYIVQAGRPGRSDVENPVYRAQQNVELHSTDSTLMLELTGKLQDMGLTLNGLHYSLSREAHARIESELLLEVLQNLQSRAQEAADALGKGKAALVEVSMDGSPFVTDSRMYMPRAMASMADAEMAAPVAEPGETTVSVSVSARAVLSP
jgi:predicted secreted protein